MSEHGPPNPQLFSHSYHKSIDGGRLRSWIRASRQGQPLSLLIPMLTRHILAITLCGALARVSVAFKKARKAEHVPFASRARQVHQVPMDFCVCFFVSLSHHKTTFHNVSADFLKPLGSGQPYVICQDKTHLEEFPLRVGTGESCVRTEGSRSLA